MARGPQIRIPADDNTSHAEQKPPLRRLEALARLRDRFGKSEPRRFCRPPEELIREDRER